MTTGKIYSVVGVESDYYRIIDDSEEPVLFCPNLFEIVDSAEPPEWIRTTGDEGEVYAYPKELAEVGFFEKYIEGDESAIRQIRDWLQTQSD